MLRALKLALVFVLLALMPLRAVAAVTIGFCAAGHQEAGQAQDHHGQHGGEHSQHGDDPAPVQHGSPNCGICVEHCSSAAFAAPAGPALDVAAAVQDRTAFSTRPAPAFIPDPQDRPPLA